MMDINGGSLEVLGNYNMDYYIKTTAYLRMVNQVDYVKVWGNFSSATSYDHTNYLTAGVLEVKGNFSSVYNFLASGTHKVILSGGSPQSVSFKYINDNHFNILEMDKAADVTFDTAIQVNTLIGMEKIDPTSTLDLQLTNPYIMTTNVVLGTLILRGTIIDLNGKTLAANALEVHQNASLDVNGGILQVETNVQIYYPSGTIDLHNGKALIKGNLIQGDGTMYINGGNLEILGNYNMDMYGITTSRLKMVNEADYVKVWGNFLTQSVYDHTNYLTAGVLEVKGNFTKKSYYNSFAASGNQIVVLSGDNTQTVTFDYPNNKHFNILVLTKPLSCYNFNQIPCWNYLIQDYDIQKQFGQSGVNPGTGNYSRSYTDMEINSPGFDVDITRTYNSLDNRNDTLLGRGWTFGLEGKIEDNKYSASLKTVRLPRGQVESFTLNADGTYTANDSRDTLQKQTDGTHILTTKDQYSYGYDTNGRLAWMKDRNGNTITINLDSTTGKINTIKDDLGRTLTFTYTSDGLLDTITDPIGRIVDYDYENKKLTKVTDPAGTVTNYAYTPYTLKGEQAQVNLVTEVRDHYDKLIEDVSYFADGVNQGKIQTVTDKYNNVQTYSYNNTSGVTTITDTKGRTTTQTYDAAFSITKTLDPGGRYTTTQYDNIVNGVSKYGEAKSITDRNSNTTTYERDAHGNITKLTNPDLSYKEFTYDEKNNIISEKDEDGKYTFYVYDDAKINLVKKAQPLNGTDQYTAGCDTTKFAITEYTYYPAGEGGCSLSGLL
jgi:YD repeat-containing protein